MSPLEPDAEARDPRWRGRSRAAFDTSCVVQSVAGIDFGVAMLAASPVGVARSA